jgi:hypothetical protein
MSEEKYSEFLYEYDFDGSRWSFTLHAKGSEEAKRRVRAIGLTGVVCGQVAATIPAVGPHWIMMPILTLVCWVRNAVSRNP